MRGRAKQRKMSAQFGRKRGFDFIHVFKAVEAMTTNIKRALREVARGVAEALGGIRGLGHATSDLVLSGPPPRAGTIPLDGQLGPQSPTSR